MEKAILKTLIYADIFDYPLTIFEIHKWLIGRKATLRQVESAIARLSKKAKVKSKNGYYFLSRRAGLVVRRRHREKQSAIYLRKAKLLTSILKVIPWVKLVGISGGLSMGNASKSDDIDLFVITSKNRLWISRLFILGILSLMGQRRKAGEIGRKIAGKLCINTLLEEDRLEQSNKDIYLAHEVLQMKVLWQKNGIYGKYLSVNGWAFKFLPNWVGDNFGRQPHSLARQRKRPAASRLGYAHFVRLGLAAFGGSLPSLLEVFEDIAKWFQLKIMGKPQGMERITDGALYFHPNDIRPKILKLYRQRTAPLDPSASSGHSTLRSLRLEEIAD